MPFADGDGARVSFLRDDLQSLALLVPQYDPEILREFKVGIEAPFIKFPCLNQTYQVHGFRLWPLDLQPSVIVKRMIGPCIPLVAKTGGATEIPNSSVFARASLVNMLLASTSSPRLIASRNLLTVALAGSVLADEPD